MTANHFTYILDIFHLLKTVYTDYYMQVSM